MTRDEELYQQGNAFRKIQDWKRALECYAEAIELNPQSPARHARDMLLSILNYRCKALLNP